MDMIDKEKVTAAQIREALRQRYCQPEYALFFEVANGTGASQKRYADAIAMSLFPSRGLYLSGFEIKVSRYDLLKELKNPQKAEEIAQYCARWFIVAPKGLCEKGELPDTWGLIEFNERQLREAKAAQRMKAKPLTLEFFAALARRAGQVTDSEVNARVSAKMGDYEKSLEARIEREAARRSRQFSDLEAVVKEFESASGVDIRNTWNSGRIGAAVKILIDSPLLDTYQSVSSIKTHVERGYERLVLAEKELKALVGKAGEPDV